MNTDTEHLLNLTTDLAVSPRSGKSLEIPDWNTASRLIFPFLESVSAPADGSVSRSPLCASGVSAERSFDPLSGMLTSCIKMSLALFYRGAVIPLSESLVREWAVSMAVVRLAMDANIALVARSSRFEQHRKGSLCYYSVHTDAAPFNSVLPFYLPFQTAAAALLGSPFYFALPERRTVILFGSDVLPRYGSELRDDILLTYETSTSYLSPELIEVSDSGVLPVSR